LTREFSSLALRERPLQWIRLGIWWVGVVFGPYWIRFGLNPLRLGTIEKKNA